MVSKLIPYFIIVLSFSGYIKWINLPIDPIIISILSISILGLICLRQVLFRKVKSTIYKVVLPLYLFLTWVLLSNIYSISNNYFIEKSILVILTISIFFFSIYLIDYKTLEQVNTAINVIFIFTILVLLYLFISNKFHLILDRSTESNIPNYLKISLLLGVGILLNLKSRPLLFFVIIALLFLLVLGARGPTIFLILLLILKFYNDYGKKVILVLMPLAILIVVFLDVSKFDEIRLFTRLMGFANNNILDNSTMTRIIDIKNSTQIISDNFILGIGNGSYGQLMYNTDELYYPHNILLEIFVEYGVIGFILFSIFIFNLVTTVHQFIQNQIVRNYAYVLGYLFLALMVSGSLIDTRLFFFFTGLTLIKINRLKTADIQ